MIPTTVKRLIATVENLVIEKLMIPTSKSVEKLMILYLLLFQFQSRNRETYDSNIAFYR